MTKIWFLFSTRSEVKASHCESGDQRGLPDDFSPRVSCSSRPDAVSASQICVT
jgi:hypothetical protein